MKRRDCHIVFKAFASTIVFSMFLIIICGAALGQKIERSQIDIQNLFTPSGRMGDGEDGRKYIGFSGSKSELTSTTIKITYTFGPAGWGGIYWQNEPDNWGDKEGFDYSKKQFSKVTFLARGEKGTEIVEFKTGGINDAKKKYRDSYSATLGRLRLSKEWKQYEINLNSADLRSVIGGFCWVASSEYNTEEEITFFVNDIFFE